MDLTRVTKRIDLARYFDGIGAEPRVIRRAIEEKVIDILVCDMRREKISEEKSFVEKSFKDLGLKASVEYVEFPEIRTKLLSVERLGERLSRYGKFLDEEIFSKFENPSIVKVFIFPYPFANTLGIAGRRKYYKDYAFVYHNPFFPQATGVVISHEVAHTLGLRDSDNFYDIMFPYLISYPFPTQINRKFTYSSKLEWRRLKKAFKKFYF